MTNSFEKGVNLLDVAARPNAGSGKLPGRSPLAESNAASFRAWSGLWRILFHAGTQSPRDNLGQGRLKSDEGAEFIEGSDPAGALAAVPPRVPPRRM